MLEAFGLRGVALELRLSRSDSYSESGLAVSPALTFCLVLANLILLWLLLFLWVCYCCTARHLDSYSDSYSCSCSRARYPYSCFFL